jgi:hypothetical protein
VECQEQALDLLADDAIPRYHRIRKLILLDLILGDWNKANECRIYAWALYELVLRWHSTGSNPTADAYLNEIRNELDDLDNALKADAPEG